MTACLVCGNPKISARGLCRGCWGKHSDAGTLDEVVPRLDEGDSFARGYQARKDKVDSFPDWPSIQRSAWLDGWSVADVSIRLGLGEFEANWLRSTKRIRED